MFIITNIVITLKHFVIKVYAINEMIMKCLILVLQNAFTKPEGLINLALMRLIGLFIILYAFTYIMYIFWLL